MPRFNGTGPTGQGPLSGRGMGPCNEAYEARQGFARGMGSRGRAFGRCGAPRGVAYGGGRGMGAGGVGFGSGRGMGYTSNVSERDFLENEKRYLEEELEAIKGLLENQDTD